MNALPRDHSIYLFPFRLAFGLVKAFKRAMRGCRRKKTNEQRDLF